MKIAILHEMFVKLGGAEKVVESFLEAFPDADLFTLIYDEKKVGKIFPKNKINKQVFNLKTQKIYNFFGKQRLCLPYMAESVEALDFSEYDVVLCSSSGFAHGAITKPETKFIVYYHSPSRYLWDYTHEYTKNLSVNKIIKYFINKLLNKTRIWDYIAAQRVDLPIMASNHVAKRLKKYYNREDYKVIYPSVEVDKFINFPSPQPSPSKERGQYFITVAALTEWKRLDVLIKAFNKMPEKKLKIVGVGNYEKEYRKMVTSDNIEFVGYKSGNDLIKLIMQAKGFLFVSNDDFGIAPVEAIASNVPVFALAKGGALETNIPGITGEFFDDENGSDFIEKFKLFEQNIDSGIYKKENLIKQAEKFSKKKFIESIKKIVEM